MVDAFVGRTTEFQQLMNRLAEAVDHKPATVLLAGDPGVGKSRLLEKFAKAAEVQGAYVLSGACIDLGGGAIPYAPLIEALRLLVRQYGDDQLRTLIGPAWSELESLISDFTGAEPASGALGSQLSVFGAVLRLLDHLGGYGPVVLIFEDIHWADPSTLDLIAYLTQAKSNQRMMLVCSYRSGLVQGHPLRALLAEAEFTRRTHRTNLICFAGSEFSELIGGLVAGPVDRDRLQRYFELSEGNPFFAELLVAAEDQTDQTTTPLPESVTEIILAQIGQLSDDATHVMRVAAVAGRRVSDRLLATVSDLENRALNSALRECLDRQILVADRAKETYAFRHALLRETVYQGLLPRERKPLHEAMAEALAAEAATDPSSVAELAHHWYEAGRKPEALASAVLAGNTAVRMRAFQEAETQYARALQLWAAVPDPEEVAGTARERVLGVAADAARWAGHVKQAVEWVQNAIAEVDAEKDPRRAGELYERLGSYQWEAEAIEDSVNAHRAAERLLAGQPPSPVKARVQATLATAAVRAGHYREGLDRAQPAIELAREVGARAEEGRALNSAGLAMTMLDRAEDGVALLRDALRIAAEVDHLEDLFRGYGNLGLALEHAGELAEAVDLLREGLNQARTLGLVDARQVGVLANNASAVLVLLGRWDDAIELLDEVLQDRPVKESVYSRLTRAEIHVARGQFDEAERLLAEVQGQRNTDPRFLGPLYACMAELGMWRADPGSARSAVDLGMKATAGSENALVLLQLCSVGLRAIADQCARLSDSPGDHDAARTEAHELIELANQAVRDREAALERGGSAPVEMAPLALQCVAERARAESTDTAETWAEVATAWFELDRPYPVAYAQWRQAEAALREKRSAPNVVRAAYAAAVRLTAEPLRAEVQALANRHRIDLTEDAAPVVVPVPARPYDRYKLTKRELVVLKQVSDGLTNRLIARDLHIEESTVSVHVSHIHAKLGVSSRTEAAAIAHRERFFDE